MSMGVSNVNSSNNAQYTARSTDVVQEKTQTTPEEDRKNLGVVLELSTNSEQAQSLAEKIRQRNENGERYVYPNAHRTTHGSNNDGMVSFYGASVTQEQSEKLQDVIKGLEQQEQDNLGDSWNVGAYAQLGLKVSQLSYACKEIGLTDEATDQIVGTYGKQAEEKINKMNDWVSYAYEQAKVAREELYVEIHDIRTQEVHYNVGRIEMYKGQIYYVNGNRNGASKEIYSNASNEIRIELKAFL